VSRPLIPEKQLEMGVLMKVQKVSPVQVTKKVAKAA
jgi:hypothetical protein